MDRRSDPFLEPRDTQEQVANDLVREFFLAAMPASIVYRQVDRGYALVAPHSSGARALTVAALNEADFMFHGEAGQSGDRLADFIAKVIGETQVDHVRLPLLSEQQAAYLGELLAEILPGWVWSAALAAVAPLANRPASGLPASFRRALARAEAAGVRIERSRAFDMADIRGLHEKRWGAGNRGASFFNMIAMLANSSCSEFFVARSAEGQLMGVQLDIVGSLTRHFYYSISDKDSMAGIGTAIMASSWRAFLESDVQTSYSFGRGTERYKFRYADSYRPIFDLRGFCVAP